ncbi:MAG TPA: hypothetical protein VFW75_17710 [Acetobacteraceae bacterium]|nr:hypothetical protein [Acetobacteraceae bacterium]
MSNRLNSPVSRQPAMAAASWTTLDYMLAAGLAWAIAGGSPILMAPPFWVLALMAPRN